MNSTYKSPQSRSGVKCLFCLYTVGRALPSLSNPGLITGNGVHHIGASLSCFSQTWQTLPSCRCCYISRKCNTCNTMTTSPRSYCAVYALLGQAPRSFFEQQSQGRLIFSVLRPPERWFLENSPVAILRNHYPSCIICTFSICHRPHDSKRSLPCSGCSGLRSLAWAQHIEKWVCINQCRFCCSKEDVSFPCGLDFLHEMACFLSYWDGWNKMGWMWGISLFIRYSLVSIEFWGFKDFSNVRSNLVPEISGPDISALF